MLSAQELEPPVDLQEAAGRLEAADSKSLGLFALGLDDNRTTFLPGQRVEGQLSLSLRQPALVQLLRIRFTGFISTHVHRKDKNLIDSSSTATLFKDLQTCIGTSSAPNIRPVFSLVLYCMSISLVKHINFPC